MGLFNKKQEEAIDEPAPQPAARIAVETVVPQPTVQAAPPRPAPSNAGTEFGIEKAIELMRQLPTDNVALVVQVVRTTLESINVDVESIIDDAQAKRARIGSRIKDLREEITDYEAEISARRELIARHEEEEAETKVVQDRLELAMRQGKEASASGSTGSGQTTGKQAPRPKPRPTTT